MLSKARAFFGLLWKSAKSRITRMRSSTKNSHGLASRFKQFPITTSLLFGGPVILLVLIIMVGAFGLSFLTSIKWDNFFGSGLWKYGRWVILVIAIFLLFRRVDWLRKQTGSVGSNVDKILKDNWRRDGIAFLVAFGLAHLLAYHYFPEWYRPFFLDPEHRAIWVLQIILIVWFLIRDEVKKHKIINFFAKAAIAITIVATLAEAGMTGHGMYNARIVASAKVRDSVMKAGVASLHNARYIPPSGYTCAKSERPIDTTFIVMVDSTQWSQALIPPCRHTIRAEGLDPRTVLLAEIKESISSSTSRIYTLIPGEGKVKVPIIRWMRLRAYDTPDSVRIHIFPTRAW